MIVAKIGRNFVIGKLSVLFLPIAIGRNYEVPPFPL
jgi:hypothetical protein